MARTFASIPGGEAINALFEALNDFINLLNLDDLKQKRIDSLRSEFENFII